MGVDHDRASGPLASAAGDLALPSAAGLPVPAATESPGADALSDVLEAVRLTGALFFIVDASPPWIAEAPDSPALAPVILPRVQHVVSYHVVTKGTCWCHMAGAAPVRLDAGDVVVIPHGDAYALSSDPASGASGFSRQEILMWFEMMASGQLPFVVREGGTGPERLGVICGFLGCDALPFNPVLATLPRLLPVRRTLTVGGDRLAALVEFAVSESREKRAGSRSVLLRLGELMFVEVVRRHLVTLPEAQQRLARGASRSAGRARPGAAP